MTECHFNLWFTQFWFPASKKRERSGIVNFLFSFAFLAFLTIPVSLIGRISLLRYSATSPPFSAGHANHFQGSLYFSFLPVKQRDFPGNVRSGGCDSLPLVVAFTSKQRDSPLSYALRFPHIISHQMCCAGERAESGGAHQTGEKSLHLPDENARKSESFLRGGRQAVKGSNKSAPPKEKEKKKQREQANRLCIYHRSMSAYVFDMLFMLEEEGPHGYLLEPKCSLELDQRPDFKTINIWQQWPNGTSVYLT